MINVFKDFGIYNAAHAIKLRKEVSKMKEKLEKGIEITAEEIEPASRIRKFDSDAFFLFGDENDYKDGLTKKIQFLTRSMQDECYNNDRGTWKKDFDYVVYEPAVEVRESEKRVRDLGNAGKTLQDFVDHQTARLTEPRLTPAEVAAVRCYTGPFYVPWNTALRLSNTKPQLLASWATCISVLYNAVFKLSFLSQRGKVYRGFNETKMAIPRDFVYADGRGFAGCYFQSVVFSFLIILSGCF
jgi:hypothetical protein